MLTESVSRNNVEAMYVRISSHEIPAMGAKLGGFIGGALQPAEPGGVESDAIGADGAGAKARVDERFETSTGRE